MLFKGEKTMKNLSIIIAFLAIILVACDAKDCEKCETTDTTDATAKVSEDCQNLCAKKGIDGDECKSYCETSRNEALCYWGCLEADTSSAECKKACYSVKKGDKCKACYDKCVDAGKKSEDCKTGCCSKKPDADAGSKPKEADAGATLPEDVSSTKK